MQGFVIYVERHNLCVTEQVEGNCKQPISYPVLECLEGLFTELLGVD